MRLHVHCVPLSSFAADLREETERKATALESTYEDFLQCREKTIDTLEKVVEETDDIYKLANVVRAIFLSLQL